MSPADSPHPAGDLDRSPAAVDDQQGMGPSRTPDSRRSDAALLERDESIGALGRWLTEVREGQGRMVLIDGEAGIGKTALLRAFCGGFGVRTRLLWGACDNLRTPRTLGPLLDIAGQCDGPLREAVQQQAKPAGCFGALLDELELDAPTILVLEDVHWADEATLDVLTMVGRRAESVPALTLVTYRVDGLASNAHLRETIGELGAGTGVSRIGLAPLSPAAVGELAEPHGIDGPALHLRTAGNPFFVCEVLSAAGEEIPPTVRDAVLARLGWLSPAARRALELVAIAPYPMELWLLQTMLGDELEHLEEGLAAGILVSRSNSIAFRHELARLAVEESVGAVRAVTLHQRLLDALRERSRPPVDPARMAHHAEAAGDGPATVAFAHDAARRASAAGAHREAAAQYARALRFAGSLDARERAAMQVRLSDECHMTADFDEAIGSLEAALVDYRSIGDPLREGDVLHKLSATLYCMGGGSARADAASHAAIEILETLPPSPELAMAYASMASRHMNAERATQTYLWGARALALAEQLGAVTPRIVALNDIGTMEYLHGLDSGREKLEQSLALAQENGCEDDAGRAYLHLSWASVRNRQYDRAAAYVRAGTEYCTARDLDLHRIYLDTHWGRAELSLGHWDAATELVTRVIGDRRSAPDALIPALSTLGLLRARRGDPAAWEPLDAARTLCDGGDLQRFGPVAIARAETLWLQGRQDEIDAVTARTLALALDRGASWVVGEIAIWRWRSGLVDELPAGAAAEPYALSIAGNGVAAAERWGELKCPYEAALALADTGEEDALRRALDELVALGARPAAAIVMRRLRSGGARGIPRGPRPQTRANPAGLTGRELEVLALLTENLRNAEIADRLVVSDKTVDHHVSAILRKLDVRSRGEAAAAAERMGLVVARR